MNSSSFQRETEALLKRETVAEMNLLYEISAFSRTKKFQSALQAIDQLQGKIESRLQGDDDEDEEDMLRQLQLLKAFFRVFENDAKFCMDFCDKVIAAKQNFSYEYLFRVLMLKICASLRKGEGVTEADLQGLKLILQRIPDHGNEAILKLTGCASAERMAQISYQEITELTADPLKQAMKLQIVSDWKYLIGSKQESLMMKSQAMRLWKINDKLKKYEACLAEQKDLVRVIAGEAVNSNYIRRLVFVRQIVQNIRGISCSKINKAEQEKKNYLRKASVRYVLPVFLANLRMVEIDRSKSRGKSRGKSQDKDLSASQLKKKSLCDQRREIGEDFLKQVQASHYACVDFMPKNRFEANRQKELVQTLGILDTIAFKHKRFFLDYIRKKWQKEKANQLLSEQ